MNKLQMPTKYEFLTCEESNYNGSFKKVENFVKIIKNRQMPREVIMPANDFVRINQMNFLVQNIALLNNVQL